MAFESASRRRGVKPTSQFAERTSIPCSFSKLIAALVAEIKRLEDERCDIEAAIDEADFAGNVVVLRANTPIENDFSELDTRIEALVDELLVTPAEGPRSIFSKLCFAYCDQELEKMKNEMGTGLGWDRAALGSVIRDLERLMQ